jgi:hypothetical protein
VLELSLREALQLGHNYIGTEHILLGLVREGEGVAAQVLVSLGADLSVVREEVIKLLSSHQGRETVSSASGPLLLPDRPYRARPDAVPVGKEWTAQVVRPGRRPEDYANAYAELGDLVAGLGSDLEAMDGSEITCTSVETADGPGLTVRVRHRVEGEPPAR